MCDKMEGLTEADIAEINGLFGVEVDGFITAEHEEDGICVIDEFELLGVSLVARRFEQEQDEAEEV